jgi:Xaa-Pro aminopeptidase
MGNVPRSVVPLVLRPPTHRKVRDEWGTCHPTWGLGLGRIGRMSLSGRRRRAVAAAKAAGVDALLVTHLPDVRWLCGFTGSNAALVVGAGEARLFTDGRYTAQAKAEAAGVRVVIVAARPAAVGACEWMAEAGVRRCGFDAAQTTVADLGAMRKVVPAKVRRGLFVEVGPLVAKLREVKDAGEIARMRAVAALGCELFDRILTFMQPGMAETTVAAELEYAARRAGAERMSFDTIVASGVRSALPHGQASSAKLPKRGFCTLDFGVVLDGYCSDMTRTVHFGRPGTGEREVYDAVLEAQEAGVAAVRAGVVTSGVDEAAREVLRRAGLDEWFAHSTGHGVGLEIHEGPRLAKKLPGRRKAAVETLKTGMIVTIEPGVYLPGRFGVRIEDTVLVTKSGCEVLTPCTKAWIEL